MARVSRIKALALAEFLADGWKWRGPGITGTAFESLQEQYIRRAKRVLGRLRLRGFDVVDVATKARRKGER